jgi:anti-sigma regulatory factor (Ser/Thr protein kinase)
MIAAVSETSQIREARRCAAEFARRAGAAEPVIGRVALVATEMATNLIKHASGGHIVIDAFSDLDGRGIELLALDKGPGMADVGRSISDGYSTGGSPGTGLGAMSRQSDRLGVFSRPGLGTAILARFTFAAAANSPDAGLGVITLPFPGETVCGDGWAVGSGKTGRTLLVVDGSGHGPEAAKAAQMAIAVFSDH